MRDWLWKACGDCGRGNVASTLGWLDHDPHERERTTRILALFKERNAVDELGLGGIRDSFADQLFPGTSTIQTRLRYMLFPGCTSVSNAIASLRPRWRARRGDSRPSWYSRCSTRRSRVSLAGSREVT